MFRLSSALVEQVFKADCLMMQPYRTLFNTEIFDKYSLKIFSKLKNAESTVTTRMPETSSKYLFCSVICAGVLDLLAIFGPHRTDSSD